MLEELKDQVCQANVDLAACGLVTLTWGNVSGINADRDRVVIKPSGVPYERLRPADMVVVDLDGRVVEGDLRPSSDTPTHVLLYRHFDGCRRHHPHAQPPCHDVRPGPAGDPLPGHDPRRPFLRRRAGHPTADGGRSRSGLRRQHGPGDRRAVCRPGSAGHAGRPGRRPCAVHLGQAMRPIR